MFLLIIILSYLLGCASTVALLLYLYTRYALNAPVVVNDQHEEQFPSFHPLPENERAKNSAVDAVNYFIQFLFQELKDSSGLRRYIMHKLNTEFTELKNSRTGKFFVHNILIQNFSIGNECPVFSDIQLERQERDERQLIKEFVARLDADYKDGFSVTLDITLLFGHKCLLYIKVKRIHGNLRLEFRREPFCHWLLVFQDEPLIDFEVKSSFATMESPHLAQLITQQLRRAMKRKQTWPSYKIRYQPFFPTSRQSVPTEILTANGTDIIPGVFDILIKYCDRLSIPSTIFDKQKLSSELVFLTVNVNKQMCADYLHINREQWPTKEIEYIRNVTKMTVKEVNYMDRIELLIEELEPIPKAIEDVVAFKAALADRNVFLMRVRGEEVKTTKRFHRLLKAKAIVAGNEGSSASLSSSASEETIPVVIGMPLLHSVRVQPVPESLKESETEKQTVHLASLVKRNETLAASTPIIRHRKVPSTAKFERTVSSASLASKQTDEEDEPPSFTVPTTSSTEVIGKSTEVPATKKPRHFRHSNNDVPLIMMNTDLLAHFRGQPTPPQKPEACIEFNHRFEFEVGSEERYLNLCLWCKAPLECGVPNAGQKLIFLGYATIALSEIVLDAHMSYKRETQMCLNFRLPHSPKQNFKKRMELSTHKGYDDNLVHGFVTINIKHRPEIEAKLNLQEKKEQFLKSSPVLSDVAKKLKEEERKQHQLKYINTINEQEEAPIRKPTDHLFEDKAFTTTTLCASCNRKIWMKSGRQCRDCLQPIHKKCEEKFAADTTCPHEPTPPKVIQISSPSYDELKGIVNIELNTSNADAPIITTTDEVETNLIKPNEVSALINSNPIRPTTATRLHTKAAAAFSALDSTARRSFRAFGHRHLQPSAAPNPASHLPEGLELSKSDESLHNSSSSSTKKPAANHSPPVHASSKIANAASSAYNKLREFKAKRTSATSDSNSMQKVRLSSDSTMNDTISEADLRDIITKCLSDENNDFTGLEHLLHERSVDDTSLYAKAREFGPELFPELTPKERKQRLDNEIGRLQQEIDLQCQIRDEISHECNDPETDENEKARLRAKIANINEKIQALGALTIFYCSGLKHCRTQIGTKTSLSSQIIDEDDSQSSLEPIPLEHS